MQFRIALSRPSRLVARAASTHIYYHHPTTPLAAPRLLATAASSRRAVRLGARPSSPAAAQAGLVAAPRSSSCSAGPATAVVRGWRGYASASGLTEEEVFSRIARILEGFDKVKDPSKIAISSQFEKDLGLDSLDTVEVVMAIEEEFSLEIPDKEADKIRSVDQAVAYIIAQPDAN